MTGEEDEQVSCGACNIHTSVVLAWLSPHRHCRPPMKGIAQGQWSGTVWCNNSLALSIAIHLLTNLVHIKTSNVIMGNTCLSEFFSEIWCTTFLLSTLEAWIFKESIALVPYLQLLHAQVLWSGEGTLYEFEGSWKERGKGELRINKAPSRPARFVMRQRGQHRLLMNANLWADMKVTPMDGGKVGLSAAHAIIWRKP